MHFTKALSILNNALQVIARRITVLLTCMSFAVWYVSLTQILPQHLQRRQVWMHSRLCGHSSTLVLSLCSRQNYLCILPQHRTTESTESFNPIICQQNFETITLQFIRGLYQDPCAPRLQLLKAGVDTAGIEIVVCCNRRERRCAECQSCRHALQCRRPQTLALRLLDSDALYTYLMESSSRAPARLADIYGNFFARSRAPRRYLWKYLETLFLLTSQISKRLSRYLAQGQAPVCGVHM